MTLGRLQVLVDSRRRVCLNVLIIRDQLYDAVPYLRTDVVASCRDERQDGVDVPLILDVRSSDRKTTYLCSKSLRQNGDLEYHVLAQVVICHL